MDISGGMVSMRAQFSAYINKFGAGFEQILDLDVSHVL